MVVDEENLLCGAKNMPKHAQRACFGNIIGHELKRSASFYLKLFVILTNARDRLIFTHHDDGYLAFYRERVICWELVWL